jgi:uncharacterized membrane protein
MFGYGSIIDDGAHVAPWLAVAQGAFWLAVVIVAAVLIARVLAGETPCQRRPPAGMDELEGRYARGEIGREEYLKQSKELAAHG